MRFVLFLLAFTTISCVKAVPQVQVIKKTAKAESFCLRGQAFYRGKLESVELCTESKPSCEKALYLAKTYGTFANLKQVDRCVKRI